MYSVAQMIEANKVNDIIEDDKQIMHQYSRVQGLHKQQRSHAIGK